jgi:hypothetical protein
MLPIGYLAAAETSTAAPWWYVGVLAGGFTILGGIVSVFSSWIIASRKNALDDSRRFESDVIAAYIRLDEIADILHNNAGGDRENERKVYWHAYREVLTITTKLDLIASEDIRKIAHRFNIYVSEMRPLSAGESGEAGYTMPEIVEFLEKLRLQIRRELRINKSHRSPWQFARDHRQYFLDKYVRDAHPLGSRWLHPWRHWVIGRYMSSSEYSAENPPF